MQAQVQDDSKARDPTKLEREGVNVDGAGGAYRALALPIFDETQWDHVLVKPIPHISETHIICRAEKCNIEWQCFGFCFVCVACLHPTDRV